MRLLPGKASRGALVNQDKRPERASPEQVREARKQLSKPVRCPAVHPEHDVPCVRARGHEGDHAGVVGFNMIGGAIPASELVRWSDRRSCESCGVDLIDGARLCIPCQLKPKRWRVPLEKRETWRAVVVVEAKDAREAQKEAQRRGEDEPGLGWVLRGTEIVTKWADVEEAR